MKIEIMIILAVLVLLFTSFSTVTGEHPSQIIVYKAKKIPKIDGKIEGGEWDDAQPYYFEKKTNKYILKGRFKMTIALKYDSENLYILVIANDDDYDDGDFVFFNIHYHPEVNPNWTWDATLLLHSQNEVTNGSMTKCGVYPAEKIDAKIKTSYYLNLKGNYYIFEAEIPLRYIPKDSYYIEVGYHDAHYKKYMESHTPPPYPWDLDDEFYMGKFSISQFYYTGNESVEDIFEEHYPQTDYLWVIVLGIVSVAVIASIVAILRKRKKKSI